MDKSKLTTDINTDILELTKLLSQITNIPICTLVETALINCLSEVLQEANNG